MEFTQHSTFAETMAPYKNFNHILTEKWNKLPWDCITCCSASQKPGVACKAISCSPWKHFVNNETTIFYETLVHLLEWHQLKHSH